MARMVRALPGEIREVALKAWLYRLAHNEAMRIVERRRPQTDLEQAGELPAPDGEDGLVARERLAVLLADLRELSERQRGALILRELEGATFAQVAEVFGGSEAAARQTVHEARLCLADFERGRAMTCDEVTRALSDGDRRRLRGRGVRAHLRECDGCRAFEEALRRRPRELAALAPPLTAPLAAGLLGKVLGGGTGTGGGLGGTAAGAGVGTATVAGATVPSLALKGLAALAVTAGLAAGTPQVVGGLGEVGGVLAGAASGQDGRPPAERPMAQAGSGGAPLTEGRDQAAGRSRAGAGAGRGQPRKAGAARRTEAEEESREGGGAPSRALRPRSDVSGDAPRGDAPRPDLPAGGRPRGEASRPAPAAGRPQGAPRAGRPPQSTRPSPAPMPTPVPSPAPAVTPGPGAPDLSSPARPGVPDVPDAPGAVVRR